MAGYPKIWTTLLDEPWFVPLSLTARGLYLQFLILAKKQGDSGDIVARGWSGLGLQCGCDRDSVRRLVRKFQQLGKVVVVEKTARKVHLRIPNYVKYQELKKFKPQNRDDTVLRDLPQQAEQSRPKQSEANRQAEQRGVDNSSGLQKSVPNSSPVMSAYFKRFGKKLEGRDYKTLLKKYGDEQLLLMMIRHITINNEIKSPVGLLIIARDAPGSHLPDDQYDNWKLEMRSIANRNL